MTKDKKRVIRAAMRLYNRTYPSLKNVVRTIDAALTAAQVQK